ncbi:MAG: methylated-DNA--[protein]-cysteine S-methyltransferase [Holophaga sp.]|nr:methylated-DNA--[protein]-cysteine S-methyltransferase [Holophaga sp.]
MAADARGALVYLGFADHEPRLRILERLAREGGLTDDPAAFAQVESQLDAYFRRIRTTFDLPLAPRGTPFQLRVWKELLRIPHGGTRTYGDLARRLGDPLLTRAVGAANGANPISIIIPCHRVVGADGSLTGYAGGLHHKRALLDHEGV